MPTNARVAAELVLEEAQRLTAFDRGGSVQVLEGSSAGIRDSRKLRRNLGSFACSKHIIGGGKQSEHSGGY